ncbi:MAG TPA: riboflavin synthase [Candidatus Deferrimicrobium sp.]|nr:riboflavin synthase [Candidatus Deferrimicrobium sp.]
MFTGIILKMGKFVSLERKSNPTLTIDAGELANIKIGDSVAINGACLTAVEIAGNLYKFNLSQETLRLANFGDLTRGSYVNVELPLTLQDFLGGHLVSGHLDGVVRVKAINPGAGSTKFTFVYQDRHWQKFLIHKGSVTLNGISLTLSEVKNSYFSVEIIPHSLDTTNLKYLRIGERVNLELDMLAKYLHNLVQPIF